MRKSIYVLLLVTVLPQIIYAEATPVSVRMSSIVDADIKAASFVLSDPTKDIVYVFNKNANERIALSDSCVVAPGDSISYQITLAPTTDSPAGSQPIIRKGLCTIGLDKDLSPVKAIRLTITTAGESSCEVTFSKV